MAEYQIVTLQEKKVAGLCARTANDDPNMGTIIGGLWQRLFGEKLFFMLPHKVNAHSIGLYSDYGDDGYDVTAGCEVDSFSGLPEGVTAKTIPAGHYAEFVVYGDETEAVARLWNEIWQMPLERTYTGDFEEYFDGPDGAAREIHVFIAIK